MTAHQGFALQERQLTRGEQVAWREGMDLRHWYPLTATCHDGDITLAWRDMTDISFTDSFFENTLARQPREQRRVCHAPARALAQFAQGEAALAPSAFVFHVSRCGSTLLTQLLALLPQCIVMSEPPIIDSLLRLHHEAGAAAAGDTVALLRQAMLAMGQRRTGRESHFVIKFDCWHLHSLDLLRQAFPGTPCLFLYRAPLAVLSSHHRQRGPQMVPGLIHPALLPLPASRLAPGDLDAYTALVLEGFYRQARVHAVAGRLRLVNYSQLPAIVFTELLDLLGLACTARQRDAMRQRSQSHSKYTGNAYRGDPGLRQPEHEARLAQLAASLAPAYAALEQGRLGGASTNVMEI
ncbi:hypothetical protein [Janthinobacterium sp. PC23-8]|uniref:hypothetical protein n=1 Tax=Janthinobacterium sp. PC23-8 TaxID=2012679 RepID=UPI000B97139B|nr:hypothetical protein [Janthinobacterium sp. PC23-8]OYO29008.1 hypothetical protein CD932_17930 [Janthinobacterium sp. PC23-8]